MAKLRDFEEAYQKQHGRRIVRLYVLDPDHTVREVTDIREWNNRPRTTSEDGPIGNVVSTVRRANVGGIEVLTMFHELSGEYEKDTPEPPFMTFFYVLMRATEKEHQRLKNAVEKQIDSQGYCRAWTWDEAMSQHKELVKTVRKTLKVLKQHGTTESQAAQRTA